MIAGQVLPLYAGAFLDARLRFPGAPNGVRHSVFAASGNSSVVQLYGDITLPNVTTTDPGTFTYDLFTIKQCAALGDVAHDAGASRLLGPIRITGMQMHFVSKALAGPTPSCGAPNLFRFRAQAHSVSNLALNYASFIDVDVNPAFFTNVGNVWTLDFEDQMFMSPYKGTNVTAGYSHFMYSLQSGVDDTQAVRELFWADSTEDLDIGVHFNATRASGTADITVAFNLFVNLETYPPLRGP